MLSISMCSGGRRISPSLNVNVYYTIYCIAYIHIYIFFIFIIYLFTYIHMYTVCACMYHHSRYSWIIHVLLPGQPGTVKCHHIRHQYEWLVISQVRKWFKWPKGCVKFRWIPLKIRFKFRLIHMLFNLQRGNCFSSDKHVQDFMS